MKTGVLGQIPQKMLFLSYCCVIFINLLQKQLDAHLVFWKVPLHEWCLPHSCVQKKLSAKYRLYAKEKG